MLKTTFLNNINFTIVDMLAFLLIFIIIIYVVKTIKNIFLRYSFKRMFKSGVLAISFIFSFALIVSSICFFYKTYMLRMLIPSIIGIGLLVVNMIIYILFFEDDGGK